MQKAIKSVLDSYFLQEKEDTKKIINQIFLYVASLQEERNDLYVLAKILDDDTLWELISFYSGEVIKMPSKEEALESLLVTTCFYLKEIKGWSWSEVKNFMNLPEKYQEQISNISLGGKINKLKKQLNKDLLKQLSNVPMSEFHKAFMSSELINRENFVIDETDLINCNDFDEESEDE